MPTYSFGEDSPLKFEISDKLANYYNEAVSEFFKAQQRFNQKYGRRWNPETEPIRIRWTRNQRWAWNKFADIFAQAVAKNGQYHPTELMSDYLVKNDSKGSKKTGVALGTVGLLGALYGYLKRP